jgi:hypothetical protein
MGIFLLHAEIMVRPSAACDKGFANLQIGAQLLVQ